MILTEKEEQEIITCLIEHNVNFKRSNHDIESIYMNAKKEYEMRQEENRYAG